MNFVNEQHKTHFEEALGLAGAVDNAGHISAYFGASLFLLSGLEYVYPRIRRFISKGQIDFEPMLGLGLSSDENMAVEFAGNLYNGHFFKGYSPIDLVADLDTEFFSLVVSALILRKQNLNISSLAA
jgi:hypothetical protein